MSYKYNGPQAFQTKKGPQFIYNNGLCMVYSLRFLYYILKYNPKNEKNFNCRIINSNLIKEAKSKNKIHSYITWLLSRNIFNTDNVSNIVLKISE